MDNHNGSLSEGEPSLLWSGPCLESLIGSGLARIPGVGCDYLGGAVLFFQLINRRYGKASTVLTSNKGFEQWGRILGDEVMAAALLDRLLHRCHIVNIRGNSYRMRRHAELSKALHPLANRTDGGSPAATEALS